MSRNKARFVCCLKTLVDIARFIYIVDQGIES